MQHSDDRYSGTFTIHYVSKENGQVIKDVTNDAFGYDVMQEIVTSAVALSGDNFGSSIGFITGLKDRIVVKYRQGGREDIFGETPSVTLTVTRNLRPDTTDDTMVCACNCHHCPDDDLCDSVGNHYPDTDDEGIPCDQCLKDYFKGTTVGEVCDAAKFEFAWDSAVPQDWHDAHRQDITDNGGFVIWTYPAGFLFGTPMYARDILRCAYTRRTSQS